jgi:hypothetical protein
MITNEYKEQLQSLHQQKKFSERNLWYNDIKKFIEKEQPSNIIDFGCSHGGLISKLKTDFPNISVIDGYDPGVPEFEKLPERNYETLISTDVIEHIEPETLDSTLNYIESLFTKSAWIIIACYPAKKYLPDGRNAHLTIETPDWWLSKLAQTMPNSKIVWSEVIVKNPDKPMKNKKIFVDKGKQIEIRIELKKI